jgi:hypothetical protein
MELSSEDLDAVRVRIETLKVEHRDLDDIIKLLAHNSEVDELQMRRLKRRKLLLKDQIAQLEGQLVPDIPA